MHHQHQRRQRGLRDVFEILADIERQFFVHVRVTGMVAGAGEHGVAVGRGARGKFGGNNAAGGGAVIHHHGLAEFVGHARGDDARHQIGAAAGCERHQKADGLAGVWLRHCRRGTQCCGEQPGHHKSLKHVTPPVVLRIVPCSGDMRYIARHIIWSRTL